MRIALTNDTSSYFLKMFVKKYLESKGHEVLDFGTDSEDMKMSYVEAGMRGARAVQKGAADLGIFFCGSGAGVMTVANKFKGIYAVVSESVYTASQARIINNSNVLCMGANVVGEELAMMMSEVFVSTGFADGCDDEKTDRLKSLLSRIEKIEDNNFINIDTTI